jgi:hypothetical protein
MRKKTLECIFVVHVYKQNSGCRILIFFGNRVFEVKIGDRKMAAPSSLKSLLKQIGYSEKNVEEIWKWYDFHKRKGAASF